MLNRQKIHPMTSTLDPTWARKYGCHSDQKGNHAAAEINSASANRNTARVEKPALVPADIRWPTSANAARRENCFVVRTVPSIRMKAGGCRTHPRTTEIRRPIASAKAPVGTSVKNVTRK